MDSQRLIVAVEIAAVITLELVLSSVGKSDINRFMSSSTVIIEALGLREAFLTYIASISGVTVGGIAILDGLPRLLFVHSSNVLVHQLLRRECAITVRTLKIADVVDVVKIFLYFIQILLVDADHRCNIV